MTDHRNLRYLETYQDKYAKLGRWAHSGAPGSPGPAPLAFNCGAALYSLQRATEAAISNHLEAI